MCISNWVQHLFAAMNSLRFYIPWNVCKLVEGQNQESEKVCDAHGKGNVDISTVISDLIYLRFSEAYEEPFKHVR